MPNVNHKKALVVFSGGQDSTTCLFLAKKKYDEVTAITYRYGQRHAYETTAAIKIAKALDVRLIQVDIPMLRENITSALLQDGAIGAGHPLNKKLPASFVPGRNALFLTMAHAVAQEIDAEVIMTGVCETDYSGYPDCRKKFLTLLELALNEGYETNIGILAPLMYLTKAEVFELARKLDALPTILNDTLTCYENEYDMAHTWGRGCGECPACLLRKKGFEEFITNLERKKQC